MELCHETTRNAMFFDYAKQHSLSLFPIEAGKKTPVVGFMWKECSSENPQDWQTWSQHRHNIGVNAERSGLIIIDIDASRIGRDKAWKAWSELCESWGTSTMAPFCHSARGGWHVAFDLPRDIDTLDLRGTLVLKHDETGKELIGAKVRGYTVAPGSYYDGSDKGEDSGWYMLMPDAPPPHNCPPALIQSLRRSPVMTSIETAGEIDPADLASLVTHLAELGEFTEYDEWVRCGMICKLAAGDAGIEAWRHAHDETVTSEAEATKWSSFNDTQAPGDCTIASLIKRGRELGWNGSIRRSVEAMFAGVGAACAASLPSVASPSISPGDAPPPDFIKTSAEFLGDFVPPDYLVNGIFERRYFYALTAQTGVGKTSAAITLGMHVVTGRPMCGVEVEKGQVLYFAGENPTDIQKRMYGAMQFFGVPIEQMADFHFMPGAMDLSQCAAQITAEVARKGLTPSLVVIDTAAAYNFGDEENSNTQARAYAALLRSLTNLPGGPCVIVLCHPTKSAELAGDMLPRGGGAFLGELDGNVPMVRKDNLLIAAPGKMRGDTGWTMRFELEVIRDHPKLRDAKGRQLTTVVARPVNEAAEERIAKRLNENENAVLKALPSADPGMTEREIAKALDWTYGAKKELKVSLVNRTLTRLKGDKLVKVIRDRWHLTPTGQIAVNALEQSEAIPKPPGV